MQVAAEAGIAAPERLELTSQFRARDPQLERLVLALRDELQTDGVGGRLAVESLTTLLVVQLLRSYSNLAWREGGAERSVSETLLRRTIEYIEVHLHADLTLPALASAAGVSPYHFARLFKRAAGVTPHQYVIGRRVDQARLLLLSTDQTVGDVAAAVGFYDQGHLARQMHRLLGVPPHALRDRTNLR